MEDKLKKLASEYRDILSNPTDERVSELDFKIADLEWEGLYITSPPSVDGTISMNGKSEGDETYTKVV